MARTQDQISESLTNSVKETDPSMDVNKGTIHNFLVAPLAPTLEVVEADVEHLTGIYSSVFKETATTLEVEALATSFSLQRSPGKKATVIQHFVRSTQPNSNEVVTVPPGTLVSNADGSIIFQTLEEVSIDGSNASAFFNGARRTYEVSTKVEAISSGAEANLPAFRINKLTTNVDGFDLTENRLDAAGGSSDETDRELVTRTETKFNGLNTGTSNGLKAFILNEFPVDVKDIAIIQPRDREFKRLANSLALDISIIGQVAETISQSFVAIAGDRILLLDQAPVLQILSATINGLETSVSLSQDSDLNTKLSTKEKSFAVFNTPFQANDIIVLTYTFNKLIVDIQNKLMDRLFDTDILVREVFPVSLLLEAKVRAVTSIDTLSLQTALKSKIKSIIETNKFMERLTPSVIEDQLRNGVVGIASFSWTKFTKKSGSFLDVELLEFDRNESPQIDDANFKLTVTRV